MTKELSKKSLPERLIRERAMFKVRREDELDENHSPFISRQGS